MKNFLMKLALQMPLVYVFVHVTEQAGWVFWQQALTYIVTVTLHDLGENIQ